MITFREDLKAGAVTVLKDGVEVHRAKEYIKAATWARDTYDLSDTELLLEYRDYREDLDRQRSM